MSHVINLHGPKYTKAPIYIPIALPALGEGGGEIYRSETDSVPTVKDLRLILLGRNRLCPFRESRG